MSAALKGDLSSLVVLPYDMSLTKDILLPVFVDENLRDLTDVLRTVFFASKCLTSDFDSTVIVNLFTSTLPCYFKFLMNTVQKKLNGKWTVFYRSPTATVGRESEIGSSNRPVLCSVETSSDGQKVVLATGEVVPISGLSQRQGSVDFFRCYDSVKNEVVFRISSSIVQSSLHKDTMYDVQKKFLFHNSFTRLHLYDSPSMHRFDVCVLSQLTELFCSDLADVLLAVRLDYNDFLQTADDCSGSDTMRILGEWVQKKRRPL